MTVPDTTKKSFGSAIESHLFDHERMEQNEEIFARYMNDPDFQKAVGAWLTGEVYERLRGTRHGTVSYKGQPDASGAAAVSAGAHS